MHFCPHAHSMLQMKKPESNNECTTLQRARLVHLRACNLSYCAERTEWGDAARVALPGQPWLSVKDFSVWNKCCGILSFPASSHLCVARSRHRVHSSGGRRRRTTGTRHIWVIVMLLWPLRRGEKSSLVTEEGRRGAARGDARETGYTCVSVRKESRVVAWKGKRDIASWCPNGRCSVCAVLPTST